jgi:hypothetical protein
MGRKDRKPKEEEVKVFEEKGPGDETRIHLKKADEEAESKAMTKRKKEDKADEVRDVAQPTGEESLEKPTVAPESTVQAEQTSIPEPEVEQEAVELQQPTEAPTGQGAVELQQPTEAPTGQEAVGLQQPPATEAPTGRDATGVQQHQPVEGEWSNTVEAQKDQPEVHQEGETQSRKDYVPEVPGPEKHDIEDGIKGNPWTQEAIRESAAGTRALPDYHEAHEPWGEKSQSLQEASPTSSQLSVGAHVARLIQSGFRDAPLIRNPATGERNPVSVNDNPRFFSGGKPRQVGSRGGRVGLLSVLPQQSTLETLKSGAGGLHYLRRTDKGESVHMERRSFRNIVVRQDESIIQGKKNLELQHYVAKKWGSRVPW